jgi:membrane dipeptidase
LKWADLSDSEEERALDLYNSSVVIDCLQASDIDDDYIRKVKDSGVACTSLGISSLTSCADRYELIVRNPDVVLGPVETAGDIIRAKETGKVAGLIGAQRADFLAGPPPNLDLLDVYCKLGLRVLQPTYNVRNIFADGCGERSNAGLSRLGMDLVDRMNRLKILYDCSHLGVKDTLDGCEHSEFPVATHSNARAVCDNVRNRTDDEIHAIAEKGGVLGIVAFPSFVKWTDMDRGKRPNLDDLVDHVVYISDLVGADHVGIGLDLIEGWTLERHQGLKRRPDIWGNPTPRGTYDYPLGLDSIEKLPNLARGLVARGFSDREIRGVLGENWLRIFKKTWGE